jgi:2-dehydropantoate 2-reductase
VALPAAATSSPPAPIAGRRLGELGLQIPEAMIDRRLDAAGSVKGHKISMLQDLERGRSLEIDALVTAVQELGRITGTPTPAIDIVLAMIQERGRQAGLYEG